MPWQRIRLEVAEVPSRTNEPRSLVRNHDVIPDGYVANVVRVETKEEILADKLVAFPAALPTYVRWRDIWDMHWLRGQRVAVDAALVSAKARDYRIDDHVRLLADAVEQLPGLVRSGRLAVKLGDFVPTDVAARTVRNQAWLDAVPTEIHELLGGLHHDLMTNSESN